MALAFAMFAAVALVMGVLRHRGAWPLARRATIAPTSLDEPPCGPPSIWHAGVLRTVEAAPFAALCEAMFQQDGCETTPAPSSGADFALHRRGELPPHRRLVRCHSTGAHAFDEPALRSFAAAIAEAQADAGILIAAGALDAAAAAVARQHAITLVDGPALLKLIVQRSARQQCALREIAAPRRTPTTRFKLDPTPAPAWFAAGLAGFVAAWITWPAPQAAAPLQAADATPARPATSHSPSDDRADPVPIRPPRPTPATVGDLDTPPAIATAPAAGREVLRCTDAGRVTYLAAEATCLRGQGERITVFPTEGVNPFR